MRKLAISLILASSLALAACGSEKAPNEPLGDAATAVASAEEAKVTAEKRAALESQLSEAKGDAARLKKVWEDASAAKATDIADAADKALQTILLPQANAAKRSTEILALKKQAPIGSKTFNELNKKDGEFLAAEAKAREAAGK